MAHIHSTFRVVPTKSLSQIQIKEFANTLFQNSGLDLERLLPVFENAKIQNRYVLKDIDWYSQSKSFQEKNEEFLDSAILLSKKAALGAMEKANLRNKDIDGLLVVTSSGFVTPTLDARIIDILELREDILRIPLTGFGCAGGAYGLARANEFANLYPNKNFLLIAVETCTLTFRPSDKRKANLIALSLFADGAAGVIISSAKIQNSLSLCGSLSYKWKNSLNVMGWDVEADGLQVIFDKSIPQIIMNDYRNVYNLFLDKFSLLESDIKHYLFHPGGKKVLNAFANCLQIEEEKLNYSNTILENYGNMSSPTVLFVIDEFLKKAEFHPSEKGIIGAMGPGFTSENIYFITT